MSSNLKRIIQRLYNDPEFTQYVAQTIKEADADDIQGIEVCEPQPPSEDFAFYATLPSTFLFRAHLKMAKFIHITIQNSQLMNHQC